MHQRHTLAPALDGVLDGGAHETLGAERADRLDADTGVLEEIRAQLLAQAPPLAPYSKAVAVVFVVGLVTYLSLLIGELVPKRLALQNPERIATLVAGPMNALSRLTAPVVGLLGGSSDLLLRLLGVRHGDEPPVTEEEIELLLQEGAEAGVFAWVRKGNDGDKQVVAVVNMTPLERQYRLGLPAAGKWHEILNTDAEIYGGGNRGNLGGVTTEKTPWHGQHQSALVTLPPLSALYLQQD